MTADRFKWLEYGDDDGTKAEGHAELPRGPLAGRMVEGGKDDTWHIRQADVEFANGDYEPALRNYSAALHYRPDLEAAWVGQARAMALLGQSAQAITWGKKGLDRLPTSIAMASALAFAFARGGAAAEALNLSDQVMQHLGETVNVQPSFWIDRGACLMAGGHLATAASCFDRAAALASDDPDWMQRIGEEYLAFNEPARALAAFNKALERKSDRPYLWLMTARASNKLNLRDRAAQALNEALKLDPTCREAQTEKVRLTNAARTRNAMRPCWIATLVFQADDHPVVEALRAWRDEVWMRHTLGRLAAWMYHWTAPILCMLLAHCVWMHAPLRRGFYSVARCLHLFARMPSPVMNGPARTDNAWPVAVTLERRSFRC